MTLATPPVILAEIALYSELLEALMLICFGLSWPISSFKSWRTKFVRGKSLIFMSLVFVGYLAGMASKFIMAAGTEQTLEWTTWLYAMNACFVALDISLYIRYRHNRETLAEAPADQGTGSNPPAENG
jgi:hypothetical protein